ncbi:MAG: MSMEG_4193 family putative phosphomutase [Candidatus Promineifilaceae bacterium]|nr:MSMEG_4193 family putative phosphomutase [Candidatus Promineifilaceae bacterium]
MTIVLLVRHGENDWVKKNRLAGWIPDIHLNENGQNQAEAVAQRLAALAVDAIYSSPVTRCLETAEYIANAQGMDICLLEGVGEVRYGAWEGKKVTKLASKPLWKIVQFFPSRMRFPKGEALREVQFRAIQAIESVCEQHEDKTIIIVSHADVIKLVLAYYLGVHMDLFQRIAIAPASVSILALTKNGIVRVLRLNDDGPLRPFKSKAEEKKKK